MPPKQKGADKDTKSKGNKQDKDKNPINLVNKPPNKRGKFKKDFSDRIDKIMLELELHPDINGKIKMKTKKKENFNDYQANINPGRFQDIELDEKDDELYLFRQNKMKKPQTASQQRKKDKELKADKRAQDELLDQLAKYNFPSKKQSKEKFEKKEGKDKLFGEKRHKDDRGKPRNGKDEDKHDDKKSKFRGFEEYYDISAVEEGLRTHRLFQGTYIRNEKNPFFNFIKCPQITERIFFMNQHDENRAMHNSTVIFKIIRGAPTLVSESKSKPVVEEGSSPEVDMILEIKGAHLESEEEEEKAHNNIDLGEGSEESDDEEEDLEKIAMMELENIPIDDSVSEDNEEEENDEEDEEDEINGIDEEDLPEPDDDDLEDDEEEEEEEEEKIDLGRKPKPIFSHDKKKVKYVLEKESPKLESIKGSKSEKLYAEIVYIVDNPQFHRKFVVTLKKNPFRGIVYRAHPIEKQLLPFELITFSPDNSNNVDSYYLAEYLYWPTQSRFPYGHIIEEIGDSGLVEVETDALLRNYNVYNKDFTPESYEFLKKFESHLDPTTGHFVPTEEDRKQREVLTDQIVVTCDPKTARDLDDALSIKQLEDDVYEIGVHIADVAHFVEEGSALDEEARLRTTSVYLVQRAIPMLPHLLSQNLCSLNPGVEKFTFSCFFYVKEDGTVLYDRPPRIVKTIIKCCVRFDYDMMQEVIEKKITDEKDLPVQFYPGKHVKGDIIKSCLKMNEIAQRIRQKRFEAGSISFERTKPRFKLDETNYPVGFQEDVRKDSNCMVEEYMLLANQFVGKFIIDTCSEIGVLRCHPPPSQAKIAIVENILKKLNLTMDFNSSKTIHETFQKIIKDQAVPAPHRTVKILQSKIARILEAARYFVVEDTPAEEWRHFALSFDVYTHFTSPIRRYPDVLVHRLAEKCLSYKNEVNKHVNKYHMLSIMDKCNSCKLNAKRVSDASQKLFMCLYMRKNPAHTEAIIIYCGLQYLELYIPMIEHEKKIFFKDIKSYVNSKMITTDQGNEIDVEFKVDGKTAKMRLKEYEPCTVYISGTEKYPIDFTVNFVHEFAPGNKTIML